MASRHEQQHNIHNQKSIFLPMFCRLSIKDVKLQTCHTRAAAGGEPSSPKVTCMGQVKRNNRVTGYPTAAAANHHKHTNSKRNKTQIFSGKTLFPNTAAVNSGNGGGGTRSCRTSREVTRTRVRKSRGSRVAIDVDQDCVDIAEMDPPLPVVKRVAPPGGGREEVNIWKRRFNGVGGGLRSLEIEKIDLPECKFQSPPILINRRNKF